MSRKFTFRLHPDDVDHIITIHDDVVERKGEEEAPSVSACIRIALEFLAAIISEADRKRRAGQ